MAAWHVRRFALQHHLHCQWHVNTAMYSQPRGPLIPEIMPLTVSDFSKSETNLLESSAFKGGTRIGPVAPGGGFVVPVSFVLGVLSTETPSNRGRGPAAARSHNQQPSIQRLPADWTVTHVAKQALQTARAQLAHARSTAGQHRIQTASEDRGSLCLQSAISASHNETISLHSRLCSEYYFHNVPDQEYRATA